MVAQPVPGATSTPVQVSGLYANFRPDWLDRHVEEIIAPEQPIIDAHHHLWHRPGSRYLVEDLLADLRCGHDVQATVYVEARSMYRTDGPEAMRPVGEVEAINAIAASCAPGAPKVGAAIVGFAGLHAGPSVRPVLAAMVAAAPERFRGIRQVSAWDADEGVTSKIAGRTPGLLRDPLFQAGFACLAEFGLSFDAFLLHPQIGDLAALADRFPATTIVLDHVGGPIGVSSYASARQEVFAAWGASLRDLSRRANVHLKLGGLGMSFTGFGFEARDRPPSSAELADAWHPFVEHAIQCFGPQRCLFESNFPPDKGTCSYPVLWNAFKRLARGYSAEERHALFYDTAARVYRLA